MQKCRQATLREILLFRQNYCKSAKSREMLIHKFKVTVEAYEELPPWYIKFSVDGSDMHSQEDVIMFRVRDVNKFIEYYPVFSAREGLRLLRKWKMEISPKLTAFAKEKVAVDTKYLRSLAAYGRGFIPGQSKQQAKRRVGFSNLYNQLYGVSDLSWSILRFHLKYPLTHCSIYGIIFQ